VEELEELAALRSVGCEVGQGFYFARPMGVADLESYLSGAFSPA
jgi:EAL domain-containing protein (putative c-di-GMP-specific phosphodiesterase class I)